MKNNNKAKLKTIRPVIKIKPIVFLIVCPIFAILFFSLFFLSFFIFPAQAQIKDAIAVRVMKNLDHLSPSLWYMINVPNPGNPRLMQIDGYEAVRDGRTVYAAAASIDTASNQIYTNIYIMSYNRDAKESTEKIFSQLVRNWRFNINIADLGICALPDASGNDISCSSDFDCVIEETSYGSCGADKSKIRRDVKRLADLGDIKKDLTDYSEETGTYPGLPQGTYISRASTSKWPSWQEELSEKLGTTVSIDPINRFSGDCDLAGYDPETCWNETVKDFQCPNDSYLYQYSSLGVCSLHCDSANPNLSTFCANNSDCPDAAIGEYCVKSSAAAGISLRLESEADPMPYSFNMASLGPDPSCPSSEIYGTLALQNITCCEPMNCASLGYSCGIYTNSCNQSISCGSCTAPEQCINGSCCVRNCAGKECGDDGCGSSCGVCDPGYSCSSSFTCVPSCTDGCPIKGETICSGTFSADGRQQINYCGYYDTDPCLEWPPTPEDCEWPYGCDGDICVCIDADGDGFTNYICGGADCDDTDLNVNPAADEICDGIDNDCDGLIDNDVIDIDNDGYIDINCGGTDCDDTDSNIHSDADETCDGIDNNCDGIIDNVDADGDGYTDVNCGGDDCDDRPNGADGILGTLDDGANISPGQPDDCTQYDGIDNDCDGQIDEHADTTEVLSNTDFETIDPDSGFPVNWSGGGGPWADVSVVNTDAHSGIYSLLLQQNPNLVYKGTCSQDLCEGTGVYAAGDRYIHSDKCTWLAGTSQCDFDDSAYCDWDGGQCIYNEGEAFDFFAYANNTMWLSFKYNVSNLAWEVGKMYITKFYYKGHSSGGFRPMMTYSLGHVKWCNEIASNWGSINCAEGLLNDGTGIPTCVDEPTHCCWSHPFQTRCYEYLPMGTVSAGDYPIWLEYSNTFVYTDEMNSHLDTIGNLRNVIGASMGYNSTDALGTDLYIDDFQILECNNRH